MIASLLELFRSFGRLFVWWVVVQPWEQALRVRLGKRCVLLGPGLHLRVPHADVIYKQATRLRWAVLTMQTLTTRDGVTLTMAGQLGYTIVDLQKLYDTLQQGEHAVRSLGQGAIARYVHEHTAEECSPARLAEGAGASLDLARYGLRFEAMQLTTFCRVKTLRVIQDQHENMWEDLLDTRRDDGPPRSP